MTAMFSPLNDQSKFAPAAPSVPPTVAAAARSTLRLVSETLAQPPAESVRGSRIRGGLPPRALRKVREFIEANLDQKISIEALARAVGLSMFHFARAFKQSEGVTPHDYLVQRRVNRAKELLAATDLPLSEIAVTVGFSDQSHCARRFREYMGVCPRDYRWSMR